MLVHNFFYSTIQFFVFTNGINIALFLSSTSVIGPEMCGIVAVVLHDKQQPAAELIYNALCMLQHRGQDAAGIVTSNNGFLNLRKQNGLVSEVGLNLFLDPNTAAIDTY